MKKLTRLLAMLFAFALVAAACGADDAVTDAAGDVADAAEDAVDDAGDAVDDAMDDGDDAMDNGDFVFDLEGREITVAVENAYLPFNYIDAETGDPGGWDYAALDDICHRLNCTVKYETFDWDPMIQAISDGQFDLAADGITITEERAQIVDYSDGYINIDQRIMVAVGSDIDSVDALVASDCKVGTQTGTTNFDTAVATVGEDRVQAMDEFGFVVQSVIVGDICAAFIDETAGQGYVGENADKIQLVGDSLSSDQLGFIFPKGSDLVEPFNLAIAAMKEDGTMERLGKEFFTDAFTITYDDIG
jgi:polar amino acid transport system substrate-binding protein